MENKIDAIYVVTGICEERHKGQTKLLEQMEEINQKAHDAIGKDIKDTIDAVHDLATVSNGKLAKVHERVNELIQMSDESKLELTKLISDKVGGVEQLFNITQHKFNHWIIGILLSVLGTLLITIGTMVYQSYGKNKENALLDSINTNIATMSSNINKKGDVSSSNNEMLVDMQGKLKQLTSEKKGK